MVARMISTNSLAAFAQEISRTRPQQGAVGPTEVRAPGGSSSRSAEPPVTQRLLDAVPPAPSKPLPRGSLLDLRA